MVSKEHITKSKLKKYREITTRAFNIAKKSINKNKSIQAHEIIQMVEAYLSDSNYFEKEKDYINAFGAIYYAHGWLDCGARLKIFKVSDSNLFTI